jgi:hypothetical protein
MLHLQCIVACRIMDGCKLLVKLVEFLLDIAAEYEEIRQRIELNFNIGNDEDEIKKSIALIQTYINNNSDQWGFVSYGNTSEAVKGADLVLGKARCAWERNKTTHAVKLALCIIREMIDLLQGADDSNGIIGGTIEESFTFIAEISESIIPIKISKNNSKKRSFKCQIRFSKKRPCFFKSQSRISKSQF